VKLLVLRVLPLLFTFTVGLAGTYQRRYPWPGDDAAVGISICNDGGVLVYARIESLPDFGAVRVLRLDGAGDTLWTRVLTIPSTQFQAALFVPDPGGGLVVGRARRDRVDWDNCILALDSLGGLTWWNAWGSSYNEFLVGALRLADGWVTCGATLESGEYDVHLDWLDDSGAVVRSATLSENGPQIPGGLTWSWDSSYLLAVNQVPGGNQYSWISLRKIDSAGTVIWSRRYGDTLWDEARSIVDLGAHGCVMAGFAGSPDSGMQGAVSRADSSGQAIWARQYGHAGSDRFHAAAVTADGDLVFAGEAFPQAGGASDIYLLRVHAAGTMVWERVIGGVEDDFADVVLPLGDSGFVLAGGSGSAGSHDTYVVRTDAAGIVGLSGQSPAGADIGFASRSLLFGSHVRLPAGVGLVTIVGSDGRLLCRARPGTRWPASDDIPAGVFLARYDDGGTVRLVKVR
jgi:hypothetical protein